MASKIRIAVLVSGQGRNLQAIIDAIAADPDYPAEIALVLCNKSDAYALTRARDAGINTLVISHRDFPSRASFDAAMHNALIEHSIAFICLAGFMRILTESFTSAWAHRMINIHPSLLPNYKGLDTHARAIANGDSIHGCTIHWVSAGVDEGEIIAQARVPILADDTFETLRARVLEQENILYPTTLKSVLLGLN